MLEEKDGKLNWNVDPKKFLDKYGPTLVGKVLEAHTREYNGNPNKTGKSKVFWQNISDTVVITSLREQLAQK